MANARKKKDKNKRTSLLDAGNNNSSTSSPTANTTKQRLRQKLDDNKRKTSSTTETGDKVDTATSSSEWTLRQRLLYGAAFIAFFAALIMLKQGEEQWGWSGLERDSSEDDVSFYEVLEIDASATQQAIKKAYRQLSLKYHPDRNPDCGRKCELMTSKVNQAHETLGDAVKRRIYDSTQGSISSIPSKAIELTYDNFDDHVTNSRGLFIIQVYAEQYAECKKFATIWEDAIDQFAGYVEFGRVHGINHVSVVRRLGASIREYPTVLAYVDGRYYQTYPAIENPKVFFDLIHSDYPTRHLWIGDETKLDRMYHKWQASEPKLPLVMVVSKKLNPSLLVSSMAKQYDGVMQFVHLYPKPASPTQAEATKQSTGRIRFLSSALHDVFAVDKFTGQPKLITVSPQGDTEVVDEEINKHTLKRFIRKYVQQLVPQLHAWSYTSVCGEHDIYCMLYVIGCDGTQTARELREYKKLVSKTAPHVRDIEENFDPKWVQFGFVNVLEEALLRPLCVNRNDTKLVWLSEAQTMMKVLSTSLSEYDDQTLFELIEQIMNHESAIDSVEAPRIVPPPPAKPSMVDELVEYVEELDWRDKDLQLNIIIVASIVAMIYACKNCGLKNAVMLLFALSIFGGALPYLMAFLGKMPDGVPLKTGRRGPGRK